MQTVAQSFQGEGGGREKSRRSRTQSRDAKLETLGLLEKVRKSENLKYADCNTCILKTLYMLWFNFILGLNLFSFVFGYGNV